MTSKGQALLALAGERFSDLTEAEKKLLHAVTAGEAADYSSPNDAENDPRQADTWDASRTIRAKVIRWLCVDREAIRQIDPHGINIDAATIEGRLDLAFATIPVPFSLALCAVKDGVTLMYADTRTLSFVGSVLRASSGITLDLGGAHINGGVNLDNGFRAAGEVRLRGTSISGDLRCTGGTFHNPAGVALDASGVQVGGTAFLRHGFRAAGEVRLVGASISGDLVLQGGAFHNPARVALTAYGA